MLYIAILRKGSQSCKTEVSRVNVLYIMFYVPGIYSKQVGFYTLDKKPANVPSHICFFLLDG